MKKIIKDDLRYEITIDYNKVDEEEDGLRHVYFGVFGRIEDDDSGEEYLVATMKGSILFPNIRSEDVEEIKETAFYYLDGYSQEGYWLYDAVSTLGDEDVKSLYRAFWLEDLNIEKEFRGQGIAKAILEELREILIETDLIYFEGCAPILMLAIPSEEGISLKGLDKLLRSISWVKHEKPRKRLFWAY